MAVEFKIKGLKKWEKALSATSMKAALAKQVRRATELNAMLAVKAQRNAIQAGVGAPNAPLTIAIKSSTKQLVQDGTLFQAITHRMASDFEAFVGVFRTSDAYNIATIVHEGVTLKVTPAMRGLFFTLWKASEAKAKGTKPPVLVGRAQELFNDSQNWKPLSPATTAITIPGRPWIKVAMGNAELRRVALKNWEAAVQAAFGDVTK